MAKKKAKESAVGSGQSAVEKKAISPQSSSLSLHDRCRRAFATQARAEIEVKALTDTEAKAFAGLVDRLGEPLHLDVAGKPVRHCDRAKPGTEIAENVGQRFAKLWTAHVRRVQAERDKAKTQAVEE